MLRSKLFSAAAIAFLLLLCSFGEVFAVRATETPTYVKLEFTGDEAEVAGFAQCDITVVPGDGCALSGYYLIYYTDGEGLLAGDATGGRGSPAGEESHQVHHKINPLLPW